MENWRELEESPIIIWSLQMTSLGCKLLITMTPSTSVPGDRPSNSGATKTSFHKKALFPRTSTFRQIKLFLSVLFLSPRMVVVMVICSAKLWKHIICFVLEFTGWETLTSAPPANARRGEYISTLLPQPKCRDRNTLSCPPLWRQRSMYMHSVCQWLPTL